MKTTTTFLMMTAAAMIGGSAAIAQTTPTTPAPGVEQTALEALALLLAGNDRPTVDQIRTALDGYTVRRVRIDDDGEVRIRAVTPDGQIIRIRVEDGQLRYRVGLFGDTSDLNDDFSTSDANGGDTSGTSDSNGGDTSGTSDANDDNGGNTSGGNDDNGGSSNGDGDDD